MEKVLPLAFNQRVVKCMDPDCEYFDKERVVSLPLIGTEIYTEGIIKCKCHQRVTVIYED